jgi:acyl-coenzyme A thioesterase PaaI-like protein
VNDPVPQSAGRLAELLGDRLPLVTDVPPEAFALVEQARALVEAVVMTDVGSAERASVAAELERLTARLAAARRDQTYLLVRHPDGRPEHLTQAGSGRLNPQAPPMVFRGLTAPPPAGSETRPVEVAATCVLSAAHAGSTGRAHGSIVSALLDEVIGRAVLAAGATGMTVNLTIDFRRATPIGEELTVTGRYTGGEGRKSFAAAEITVDGTVTAEGRAVFVRERRPGDA